MKARPVTKEKPIKPMKGHGMNSIPPEDIGQYITAVRKFSFEFFIELLF